MKDLVALRDAWKLESWLKRVRNPTKRGTRLGIRYVASGSYDELYWWHTAFESLKETHGDVQELEALDGMDAAVLNALAEGLILMARRMLPRPSFLNG